jgi:hypothetical protein
MKNAIVWRSGVGRMLVLVTGLLLAAGVGAQPPASDAKAATPPTKAAKVAKTKKPAAPEFKLVLEPKAMDLLKATSARLAKAKAMSFIATVGYEYPSKLGPPIAYTMRYDVTMQRPDKLKILMPGDGPASEFYYDGKAMMAYAPAENLVAVAAAPPTIEEALKAAYNTAALYFPFVDLLVDDPYAALTEGAILAFYIGPSTVVAGTKTDMVAWANKDVFLQIWIGADDKLPRKIRAVYRDDPSRLRHDMELSNWQLDVAVPADAFKAPTEGAKPIEFARPDPQPPPGAPPAAPRNGAAKGTPSKPQ